MKLREVMTQNVEVAELTMNLQEVATKMKTLNGRDFAAGRTRLLRRKSLLNSLDKSEFSR